MVVVKYKKINEGMFFSHLNMLRLWNRILSISDVEVNYSQGFNKTRRLFFSSPTRVGVESFCEYIVIDTKEQAKVVENKIENNLPSWMEIVCVYDVDKKLNVAALNVASKYLITFDEYRSCKEKIKSFFALDRIIIPVIVHGEMKEVEVKNRIYDYSLTDDGIKVIAGVGDKSVRIDEFVKKLMVFLGIEKSSFNIVKEELYAKNEEGQFVSIDKIAETMNEEQ